MQRQPLRSLFHFSTFIWLVLFSRTRVTPSPLWVHVGIILHIVACRCMTDVVRGFIITTPLIARSYRTKPCEIQTGTPLKGAAVMQMSVRRVCECRNTCDCVWRLLLFGLCFLFATSVPGDAARRLHFIWTCHNLKNSSAPTFNHKPSLSLSDSWWDFLIPHMGAEALQRLCSMSII